jgi:hypothetical protein
MGAAIDALGDSIGISTRNPNLVLGGAVATVLIVGVGGVLSLVPLFGPMVLNIVVTPVALAGRVAMANAAADDSASSGDFTGGISDHSFTPMGAYALLFVVQMALGIVFVMTLFVVGIGVPTAGATSGDPSAMSGSVGGTILPVFAVFGLLAFLVFVFTQFLDVAVVGGHADATGSFAESIDLVTSGPLGVVGYSLLRAVVAFVGIGLPLFVGAGTIIPGLASGRTLAMALGGAVIVVAAPVGFAFVYAYHVAYYRRRSGLAA